MGCCIAWIYKSRYFPILSSNNGTNLLFVGLTIDDAFSYGNDVFDFIPAQPIVINQPLEQLNLYLYDEDNGSNEFMGGWDFNIYSPTTLFPQVLHVGNENGYVKFALYLTYEW